MANNSVPVAKLGVDIALLWRGDMLAARFFAAPTRITAGPDGTFIVPVEVLGGAPQTLISAGADGGFRLHLDNPVLRGHVIEADEVQEITAAKGIIALTPTTRAVLVFDTFTFIISREPVATRLRSQLCSRDMVPLGLCWALAAFVTAAPLLTAYMTPAPRLFHQLRAAESVALRQSQLIEISAVIPATPPGPAHDRAQVGTSYEYPVKPRFKRNSDTKQKPPQSPRQAPPKASSETSDIADQARAKAIAAQLDAASTAQERRAIARRIVVTTADASTRAIEALMPPTTGPEAGVSLAMAALMADGDETASHLPRSAARLNGNGDRSDGSDGGDGAALMAAGPRPTALPTTIDTRRRRVAALARKQMPTGVAASRRLRARLKARHQPIVRVSGTRRAKMSGGLSPKQVREVIRRKIGAIRSCYQRELQQDPTLAGTVQIRFSIQPSGATFGASVRRTSLHNGSVERCILQQVRAWHFPQTMDGSSTQVQYPFRFSVR